MKQSGVGTANLDELCQKLEEISESENTEKSSISSLLTSLYRPSTIGCVMMMFSSNLSAISLFLGSGEPGRLLIDNLLLSLFDMVGVVCMSFFLDKFGRPRTLVACFLVIGTNLILSTTINTYFQGEWASVVSNILKRTAKTANGISFGAAFSYTAELFPVRQDFNFFHRKTYLSDNAEIYCTWFCFCNGSFWWYDFAFCS